MNYLYIFSCVVFAFLIYLGLIMLSVFLFGYNVLTLVFGNSGLDLLLTVGVGLIAGWIYASRIQDKKEQERIDHELEQDRIRYERIIEKAPD